MSKTPTTTEVRYQIEHHSHRFALWAAGRAAGAAPGFRFKSERWPELLKACGPLITIASPDEIPGPEFIDRAHKDWRTNACEFAKREQFPLTHGVAAKLINVYLKSRFVCGGHHLHPNVAALHPPIDRILLRELAVRDFGGAGAFWRQAAPNGWSNLCSDRYETIIDMLRKLMLGNPLWMIEEHWKSDPNKPVDEVE